MFLQSKRSKDSSNLASGANIIGDVWVHSSAKVDPSAVLGPNVVVGAECNIGPGSKIYDSTILPRTVVQGYSLIQGSIIGWQNTIGKWVRINGLTVTAEDVQIKDEIFINGVMVLPHKQIASHEPVPGKIIM